MSAPPSESPPASPQPAPSSTTEPPWTHPRYALHERLGSGGMGVVYRARDRLTGAWVALKRVRLPSPAESPSPSEHQSHGRADTLPPPAGMTHIDVQMSTGASPRPTSRGAPLADMLSSSGSDRLSSVLFGPLTDLHPTANKPAVGLALAREFRTLASLRHLNIVSVFDYGFESAERPFFTMELLPDAEPILRVCRGRDLAGRVALLLDVLGALAYLHRRGVLHCDLKPGNVLVSGGRVVVLDFGLAVLQSVARRHNGDVAGTLHYIAPELFLGQAASEASDLYAFGVMAMQVLTGSRPFENDHSEPLITRLLNSDPVVPEGSLPTPLRRVLLRLLCRDPKARLNDALQVMRELAEAVGLPPPDESAQAREGYLQSAAFVGRDGELSMLRAALGQVLRGSGGLWLVGGESGVGKSRLLDEVRTLALVRGAHVDRGQATAQTGSAYQIFLDALRGAALDVPLSPLEAGTLHTLLPDLPLLLGRDIPPAPELEAQAARARLSTVLCDVLLRRTHPTVLILEDLHWAAQDSRDLLLRLQPALADKPLLILASYRDDECPQLPSQLPGAHLLPLQRLSPRGTNDLIESMLGTAGCRPDLVRWLREQTEGNPFFLVETVRALAEEAGSLTRVGIADWQGLGGLRGGLATVVQRRLSRLPAWTLPALRQAAVVGRRIDRDLMHTLIGPGDAEVDRFLAACADAAVLDVQNEHWQFAHDKLREGVLAALTEPETRTLHLQVADALERTRAPSGETAATLAYHLHRAGELARAFRYALLASEAAMGRGALREAHSLLLQAQQLEPQVSPSQIARVRVRRLLGTATLALGHIDDCMRITEEGLQILGLPLPVSERQLVTDVLRNVVTQGAYRIRARFAGPSGEHFPSLTWLEPSIPPDLQREATGLLAAHAEVALYLFSDRRLFFCSLALANIAERVGDDLQRISSYSALAYTANAMSLRALSDLYLQQADELRRKHPGTVAEFKFLRVRGSVYISQARFPDAERDLHQAEAIARDIGDAYARLVAMQQTLWIWVFRAQLDRATDLLDRFAQLAEQESHSQFSARARIYRAQRLLDTGQHVAAQVSLREALSQTRETRDLTFELYAVVLHARAAIALSQWETARADTDVALSIFAESTIINYGVVAAAQGLVEVCFALLERAQPLLRPLRRARLQRAMDVLRRLAGHHEPGRPALLRAQARLLRLDGGPPDQVAILEDQAQVLAQRLTQDAPASR